WQVGLVPVTSPPVRVSQQAAVEASPSVSAKLPTRSRSTGPARQPEGLHRGPSGFVYDPTYEGRRGSLHQPTTHLEIRRLESAVRDMAALVDMGIYVEVKHVEGSKNPADCCTRPSIDDPPSVPTRSLVLTAMHTATPVSIGQDGYHPTEATDPSHSDSTAAGVDYVAPVPPTSSGADVRARVMVVDIENYFNSDRIRALQLADGRTRSIIETLENVTSNEVPNGLKLFFIGDDGILYFKGVTSVVDNVRSEVSLPVVPRGKAVSECFETLHQNHSHAGAPKLLAIYQQHYYTPKVRQLVRRLLQYCDVCQRARERNCSRRAGG
ncbi:hypothetical protein FOZ62_013197, partial [Perkinsus olseni]